MTYEVADLQEWLEFGFNKGWISDVFCNTHDGGPMTDEEEQGWEDGEDPCMQCVRIKALD